MNGPAIPPSMGPREIMPADRLVGDGWRALEQTGGPRSEIAEAYHRDKVRQSEAAQQAALLFAEDPRLRPLLEYLTDMTLRRPMVLGLGPGAQELALIREGQNQVIWLIYQLIAQARGEFLPNREGPNP